jgi:hypothetical protein
MFRHRFILTFGFLITLGWLGMVPVRTPAAPGREKKPSAEAAQAAPGVLKSEANMVLVNVIVTDKRGIISRISSWLPPLPHIPPQQLQTSA